MATVSRVTDSAMSVGGGDMLLLNDRCLDSSTWAFLLWLGARCGMAETSSADSVEAGVLTRDLLEKKSLVSLPTPKSEKGVRGVTGERSVAEELSAVKNDLSMLEKSLSEWMESDEEELLLDSAETLRISGALSA